MIKPGQKIKVLCRGSNKELFLSKHYPWKYNEYIEVNAEDLPHGSHSRTIILCDHCHQDDDSYETEVCSYYKCHDENMGDFGPKCRHIKSEQTCYNHYGVKHPLQSPELLQKSQNTLYKNYSVKYTLRSSEILQRFKKTNLEKLGVEYPMQSEEVKNKSKYTNLEKLGVEYPMQSELVREKSKKTNLDKYGVEYSNQSSLVRDKTIQTNLLRYGVKNPLMNPDIRRKAMQSFLLKDKITSIPQERCAELLKDIYSDKVICDVLENNFCLDFVLNINGCKIDIEYDGWYWHHDKISRLRDLKRDKVLQKLGYKTLRIRSAYQIPEKDQIIHAVDILTKTDSVFQEIILEDWKKRELS